MYHRFLEFPLSETDKFFRYPLKILLWNTQLFLWNTKLFLWNTKLFFKLKVTQSTRINGYPIKIVDVV